MFSGFLVPALVFLAAAAIAAPLGKRAKIGSILGYLIAGILIGPYGIGQFYELYHVETVLHIAEFGVVLLLFTIGLELQPQRLWEMRMQVFGCGGLQVAASAILIATALWLSGRSVGFDILIGAMLALSSTAFVLQMLDERGELTARHGRTAFSILLFQDLAAIPILAMVPLFAAHTALNTGVLTDAVLNLAVVAGVFIVGRYVLRAMLHMVAETRVHEAMTATALFMVTGVAGLMQWAGLSAALGAFLAGVLFAGSSFRHELEADVAPFKGLFLALFFIAVGMGLDLSLIYQQPGLVIMGVMGLMIIKATVLFVIGLLSGLNKAHARRLALTLAQGGEFAFVILTAAVTHQIMAKEQAALIAVIVTLSMAITPLLILFDDLMIRRRGRSEPDYEHPPSGSGHVVIAGFGRFGQIIARILRARQIPFTALDKSSRQVNFISKFGSRIYYGDASRLDILKAAQTQKARAFVVAVDDPDAAVTITELVRKHFPQVPIYARARNRTTVYRLMDAGAQIIERETYQSALGISRKLLSDLGFSERDVTWSVETFRKHDEKRLYDDYKHFTDMEKIQARAREEAEELERLFAEDAAEQRRLGRQVD